MASPPQCAKKGKKGDMLLFRVPWMAARMRGKPRIYRLERRQQPAGGGDTAARLDQSTRRYRDQMEIGTFIKTKAHVADQPRGVQLEYRVVVINSGGEAVSGVVDVVL